MNGRPLIHKLQIDDTIIEYTVQRDRRRKKIVQIGISEGAVVVKAPWRASNRKIQEAVRHRSGWILHKLAADAQVDPPLQLAGDTLPYSERQLPLLVEESERAADQARQIALEQEAEKRRLEGERDKLAAAQQQAGQQKQEAERDQQAALTSHNAELKKPELEDFGITAEQYAFYARDANDRGPSGFVIFLAFALVISLVVSISLAFSSSWVDTLNFTLLAILFGWPLTIGLIQAILLLLGSILLQFKKRRLLKCPAISQIKQYEAAQAAYRAEQEEAERQRHEAERLRQKAERQRWETERARQAALKAQQRKHEQYWESLGGIEFEQELGKLFRAQGYNVKSTPTSGDQGIDLILRKDGKTTVVQCKAHKRPASPAMARELYGSMHAFGADYAILACTGGFTDGVVKFGRGKPIELISAWDIARMAEETGEAPEIADSPPVCPTPGCGETMVLREGYSIFWGCPSYPACRGTRDF